MNNLSRRFFFKASSAATLMAGGMLLNLSGSKLANAQENENKIFLPLVNNMTSSHSSEMRQALQKLNVNDRLISSIEEISPYVNFVDGEYKLDNSFDAELSGIDIEDLTIIDSMITTKNSQLKNDSKLLEKYISAHDAVYAAQSCNRSGTEWPLFGWYYKVYLSSSEAQEMANEIQTVTWGSALVVPTTAHILQRYFAIALGTGVGLVTAIYLFIVNGTARRIKNADKGCGVIMYVGDMQVLPFWVSSQ